MCTQRYGRIGDVKRFARNRAVDNHRIRSRCTGISNTHRKGSAALEIDVVNIAASFAIQGDRASARPTVDRECVRTGTTVEIQRAISPAGALQRNRSRGAI